MFIAKTLYGLKQAEIDFWREIVKATKFLKYKRNRVDPCLFYKQTALGLLMTATWVDDTIHMGMREDVLKAKKCQDLFLTAMTKEK